MQESAKDNAYISSTYKEENAFCKIVLFVFLEITKGLPMFCNVILK